MIEWSIFQMNWIVRTLPVLLAVSFAYAQEKPPAETKPAAEQNAPEMVQHDEAATFRTRVNLVMVPVVVHNRKGDAVGNLEKEDFSLFDKGKLQEITRFSVEKTGPGEPFKRRGVGPHAKTSPSGTGERREDASQESWER